MDTLDVIGERLSRNPWFLANAKPLMKGVMEIMQREAKGDPIQTLDAVDALKHALSFAHEQGNLF